MKSTICFSTLTANTLQFISPRRLKKTANSHFLDLSVRRQEEGLLSTTIYRKPTHTGRYLNFNLNVLTSVKRSVALSLFRRRTYITDGEKEKKEEETCIMYDFKRNGFPTISSKLPDVMRRSGITHRWTPHHCYDPLCSGHNRSNRSSVKTGQCQDRVNISKAEVVLDDWCKVPPTFSVAAQSCLRNGMHRMYAHLHW